MHAYNFLSLGFLADLKGFPCGPIAIFERMLTWKLGPSRWLGLSVATPVRPWNGTCR